MKDSVTNVMHKAGRSPWFLGNLTPRPAACQNLDFRLLSGVQNTHEFSPTGENSTECRANHFRTRASIPQASYFHDVAALPGPETRLAQR